MNASRMRYRVWDKTHEKKRVQTARGIHKITETTNYNAKEINLSVRQPKALWTICKRAPREHTQPPVQEKKYFSSSSCV